MPQQNLFLVLSSGYCGSLWLAASLDKHQEISCTCNALVGLKVPHDSGFDFAGQDPGLVNAMIRNQDITTVDELFDHVAARKPAKVVGDVHGYRVSTYREAVAKAPHRPAAMAHLVRHPAVLMERITLEQIHRYKSFQRMQDVMKASFQRICQTVEPILAGINWQISGDLRGLGFLFALNELLLVFDDLDAAPELKLWTFEDLTSSRDVFTRLVEELSCGTVSASDDYLNTVFDPDNLNNSGRYRKTGVNMSSRPDALFSGWAAQEQEAFRRLLRIRNVPELYKSVGYDFAFAV